MRAPACGRSAFCCLYGSGRRSGAARRPTKASRLSQLRYEPPSQPVSRADLARLVPFEPGMPLHLDDVRFAIKRLYATGEYSNIEVETRARSERRRADHSHDGAVVRRTRRGARQGQTASQRRPAGERRPAGIRDALRRRESADGHARHPRPAAAQRSVPGQGRAQNSTAIPSTSRSPSPFRWIPASARG